MNPKKTLQCLDDALILYFSLIDDYSIAIFRLSEALKKGYFCIAKANYVDFYTHRFFTIQENYDKRMKAVYGIHLSRYDTQSIERVNECITKTAPVMATGESFKVEERIETQTNPLHWFGVLVPQELRDVQKYFKNGLEEIIRITNLCFRLDNLEKQILLYRKDLLYLENV